jgi:hypothetical protein
VILSKVENARTLGNSTCSKAITPVEVKPQRGESDEEWEEQLRKRRETDPGLPKVDDTEQEKNAYDRRNEVADANAEKADRPSARVEILGSNVIGSGEFISYAHGHSLRPQSNHPDIRGVTAAPVQLPL